MPIPIPTSGLITYLDFQDPACFTNGGTLVTDLSGVGNNFEFRNDTTPAALYSYDPTFGTITLAPGLGNLTAVNQSYMDGTGNFTISFWLYVDSAGILDQYVFYIGGYAGNYISIDTRNNSYIRVSGSGIGYLDTTASSLDLNSYNSITVTYDGSTIDVYINNLLEASGAASVNLIGGSGTYPGLTFNLQVTGTGINGLALVSIYNTAITTLQRGDLYQVGYDRFNPPLLPVPIGQYDFSNVTSYPGSGGNLYDLSGTGNTLNNAALSGTFGGTGQSKYYSFVGGADQFAIGPAAGFAGTILTTASSFIWIKSPDWNVPGPGGYQYMTGWGLDTGTGGGHIGFTKKVPSAGPPYYPDVPGAMCGSGFGFTAYSSGLTNDNWYHLGYVIDGINANLYLDGVLVGQVPQDFQYSVGLTGLLGSVQKYPAYAYTPWICLGGLYINYASSSNYSIAVAEFYATDLSAADALQLYNSQSARFPNTPPPPPPGIIGGRRFGGRFAG